jgi:hypothetical protein
MAQIQQMQVYQVKYCSESPSKPTAICQNSENQPGSINLDWSEVTATVVELLSIFKQVVDINVSGKLECKTQTQDCAQFCDLHLPARNSILQIYDNGYEFQQGLEITPQSKQNKNTIRNNWNSLMKWVQQDLCQIKTWSDFQPFGKTVLDQIEVLNQIASHLQLFRREKTNWDSAFDLYSGIVFVKDVANKF